MVGSMYFPSVTELFMAQPPIYLITGRGAPMQLAAESNSFPEAVRCPFKTGGSGRVDCEEGKGEPCGDGGRGPPIGGGFSR
jgi:hypothetical protein